MSWSANVEARTLGQATKHRATWTDEDLKFVEAFADETSLEELALALGRSYFAVATMKRQLSERMSADVEERRTPQATKPAAEKGWTFVGDDVPPGWW